MKLKHKDKTVTTYTLKLSENEAQALLSDIVDLVHLAVDQGKSPLRYGAVHDLKLALQGID